MGGRLARLSARVAGPLPLLATWFPAVFLAVSLARFRFPYELEWLEGSSIEAARRLVAGRALYVPPTLEYVPPFYVPFFHYLAYPFALAAGVFAGPRLLSILCVLGTFAILTIHVRRATGGAAAGWIAACTYAAFYPVCAGWFDLARVDSLFVFLSIAALHVVRFGGPIAGPAGGAALIALACLTKQTGVLWFLPVVPAAFLLRPRRGLLLGALVVGFLGGATLLLDAIHDGWYLYYTRKLVSNLDLDPGRLLLFAGRDIALTCPLAVVLAVFAIRFRPGLEAAEEARDAGGGVGGLREASLDVAFLAGGLIAAFPGRLHPGGDLNSLMPLYASLSLFCGLAFGRAEDRRNANPPDGSFAAFVPLILLMQFAMLARDPIRLVPRERDRIAYRALQERIASIEGEVFVPFHPCLASPRPGMHAHAIALFDVVRRDRAGEGPRMAAELREAFRERRFAAVVVGGSERLFERDLERDYYRAEKLFEAWPDVHPRSGFPIRPAYLYLPRPEGDGRSSPPGARKEPSP